MILSDATIREKLESEEIGIEPGWTEEQIQPASFDIRLGRKMHYPDYDYTADEAGKHAIRPGEFCLGHSKETISLPDDVAAQLTGRSTIARNGLCVHITAGFFDPQFSGEATFEFYNMSKNTIKVDVGTRIAQLVFFKTDRPTSGYSGQYQGQTGPTEPGDLE